jgi:IPT/TIG domain-containing protein
MFRVVHGHRAASALALTLAIAGCGGGGGGGGGGGSGSELRFSLSTNTLTFSAANQNAATPASQIVTATVTGSGGSGILYIIVQPSNPAMLSISNLIITPPSGQASVNPAAPSTLGVGTFTSTVTVLACANDPTCATGQLPGSPQVVNVTYTISGVAASPSSLSYSIGNTPIPADFTRQIDITGAPNQSWTASSTVPWLSVSPTSGSTAATVHVTASLDQAQVAAMDNGTYTGSIQVVPASAGLTLNVPITLTVARTQVNYVAPYVGTSSTSAPVIIRGENFSAVTIQDVKFDSTSAATFSVVSDTEVHATYPGLAAGTYPVQLQSNLGASRSLANLVVVDAPPYTATTIAYPDATSKTINSIRYDAERQALIAVVADGTSSGNNRFFRSVFGSGSWGAPTSTSVFNLTDMALSTDGKVLLAETSGALATGTTQYDAATLVAGTTTDDSINFSGYWEKRLAVANDGTAVIVAADGPACGHVIRYRLRNPQVTDTGAVTCLPPFVGGSADGSIIVAGSNITTHDVYAFSAADGTMTPKIQLTLTAAPALDRSGSRIVLNNTRVYDSGFNLLPGALPGTTSAVVLKSDGTTAYTYDSSGMVRKFDLTGIPVAGIYPEIGSGTSLAGNPGSNVRMTITPNDGTLFLAGGTRIVVLPAP